jgi:hypothetical protein
MFVRWLTLALAVCVVLLVGCGGGSGGGNEVPKDYSGDWTGTLKQKGLHPFQVAARIDLAGSGRVAYTGIDCGGTWTSLRALRSDPPYITVRERINQGAGGECKGSGLVGLHPVRRCEGPEHDQCEFRNIEYTFTGGGVSSQGLLHRTDAAGLKLVFDEAGVNPP